MTKILETTHRIICNKWSGVVLVIIFVAQGLFLVGDYGISIDEPVERGFSHIVYKHVMEDIIEAVPRLQNSEGEMAFLQNTGDFSTYYQRWYGAALQLPMVVIEHLNNFNMNTRDVYLIRHTYNFLTYALGVLFFYLILRRRFSDSPVPLFGLVMHMLYPRFFAEAFYNNKDIIFYSWFVITVYFALRFLEKQSTKRMLIFAGAAALCTNTRILGVSVVLLVIAYIMAMGVMERKPIKRICKASACVFLSFFMCYILITPVLWGNPITSPFKGFIDTFKVFSDFSWPGKHLYFGEYISRYIPWHYLPVWMGITIPILYINLFLVGVVSVAVAMMSAIKSKNTASREEVLYDSFFSCLFFCTLIGYIFFISMYEGWRHAYAIFCPFLFWRSGVYMKWRSS